MALMSRPQRRTRQSFGQQSLSLNKMSLHLFFWLLLKPGKPEIFQLCGDVRQTRIVPVNVQYVWIEKYISSHISFPSLV